MKKVRYWFLLMILCGSTLLLNVSTGYAFTPNQSRGDGTETLVPTTYTPSATAQPLTVVETPAATQTATPADLPKNLEDGFVLFSDLGEEDLILRGPYDNTDVRFTPPSSWLLASGGQLNLVLDVNFSGEDISPTGNGPGASLEVSVNDEVLTTLFIDWTGSKTVNLSIPLEALTTLRKDGRHTISFVLDASIDCRLNHETRVAIRSSSWMVLPHTYVEPLIDLSRLPRPIYQPDSFLPEASLMVLPDSPSVGELQAAVTVAAAFSRMSSGELVLPMVRISSLTQEQINASHLVFVGKPTSFANVALLSALTFGAGPEDGILKLEKSIWNSSRVTFFVFGETDAGLLKAAQALTFGLIQPQFTTSTSPAATPTNPADLPFKPGVSNLPSQAVISDVNTVVIQPTVSVDRTFSALGYTTRTISGYGVFQLEYHFYMPPGQVPGKEPFLDLVFAHSALMDLSNSGLLVTLNDQRIGSTRLTEETAKQTNNLKMNLRSEDMIPGDNKLIIQVDMRPSSICVDFNNTSAWFTLNADSLLHLPLEPAMTDSMDYLIDLSIYPYPFASDPMLKDLAFVVSPSDPDSWSLAGQFAAALGRRATGQLLLPRVVFASDVNDEIRNNYHLLVFGRPSQLDFLQEVKTSMPVPFEAGKDLAVEASLPITYRLPDGASLGYLEVFPSPWNASKGILTVLGSTQEGLQWAGQALLVPSIRSNVRGNYAVINRDQVLSTDTRLGNGANLSATAVPGVELTQVPTEVPVVPTAGRPIWMLPAIIGISVLTVVLLIFVLALSFRRRSGQ